MGSVVLIGYSPPHPVRPPYPVPPPLPRGGFLPPAVAPTPPQPKLRLSAGALWVVLPFAPMPTTHGGFGWNYTALDRGGRKTLQVPTAPQSRTLSWQNFIIGVTDWRTSIDATLTVLELIASSKAKVAISYARPERGVWQLTDFTYDIDQRAPGTNAPTRARANLTFTEWVDLPTVIGPPRPAARAASSPAAPAPAGKPAGSVARYYTTKSGDTLFGIAFRFYARGDLWPRIADANGIRDPARLGSNVKLRIP